MSTRATNHEGKSNISLAEAVKEIRDSVQKAKVKNGQDFLFNLNEFISDRVRIILVIVSDEADAYLIFETLNDRGLDLSMSDLLKNYIFGRAGDQLDVAKRHWSDVEVRLDDENLTQFLRHHWLSRYGVVRERDLYKSMKKRFSTQLEVLELMEELVDAADKYAAISNVDHQLWKGLGTGLRKDLEALQLFGLSQFRPLMLAGLSELDRKALPELSAPHRRSFNAVLHCGRSGNRQYRTGILQCRVGPKGCLRLYCKWNL